MIDVFTPVCGGRLAIIFFYICTSSHPVWLVRNYLYFCWFFINICVAFCLQILVDLSSFYFGFDFFSDIKGVQYRTGLPDRQKALHTVGFAPIGARNYVTWSASCQGRTLVWFPVTIYVIIMYTGKNNTRPYYFTSYYTYPLI